MKLDRRSAFKVFTVGCGGVLAGRMATAKPEPPREAPADAVGMLYDTTLCIGCKACVSACSDANGLPTDPGLMGEQYQAPRSLNSKTKNLIKIYQNYKTGEWSFMKAQCMHCIDPSCVTACPLSALSKGPQGIVEWDGKSCLGCRCCQISCPYNIPKFEWASFNPKIVKCELCRHLLVRGGKPACTTACPRGAVIFGTREQLLREARERIAAHPGKYFQNRIYGEKEGGGTQVLYLSHVPFEKLGLPEFGNESIAAGVRHVQERVYQGGLTPLFVYGGLIAATRHFWSHHKEEARQEAEETGLGEQL